MSLTQKVKMESAQAQVVFLVKRQFDMTTSTKAD